MQKDTEIRWIPLRNLEPSDRNARTTAAPAEAMGELEASLEAHGLLENLLVRAHDDGKTFHVVGGGRRLRALRTLAKKRKSKFRTTTPIPCRVMPADAIDEEISAAENLVRVNMHPVDEFTAFHTLLERGLSAREIANRFGLTARTVQRRLRLGGIAPEILGHARDGQLTIDPPPPAGTSFGLVVITPPPYDPKVPHHDLDDDAEMYHLNVEYWPTATAVH